MISEAIEIQTIPLTVTTRRLTAVWWAVIARFLVHGLVTSTWLSRIPAIQTQLHLNNGVLGLSLLGAAVGSLCSIPVCGRLVVRYGSSRVTNWTAIAFCLALVLPGLAFSAPTLFLALAIYGAAAGANDVAMNAQGVAVENVLAKPTMSRFHAMFSIGGMIGAGFGGLVAAHHIQPLPHLVGGALVFLTITLSTAPLMSEVEEHHAGGAHRLPLRAIPPVLVALCAIGFCAFLSEGAMADWIAVYLKQVLNAGQGLAAIGYAVFSTGMAIFRLLGDAITARLGPARTVRVAALVAMFGLAFALLMPSPYLALPGFAATGAGFSVIIPLVFAAGGRVPSVSRGAGIATVSGIGYLAFLFGPPSIGFLSQLTNLRYALFLIVALMLVSAGLSRVMEKLSQQEA